MFTDKNWLQQKHKSRNFYFFNNQLLFATSFHKINIKYLCVISSVNVKIARASIMRAPDRELENRAAANEVISLNYRK